MCVSPSLNIQAPAERLSGGGDSCGSTHTLVTVHWIPCACNCGLVSSCVSPQSVRGVVGFAPLTDIYIAMLLGPDVPPWQMRWARRPGIAPPDTFGALSICLLVWFLPGHVRCADWYACVHSPAAFGLYLVLSQITHRVYCNFG